MRHCSEYEQRRRQMPRQRQVRDYVGEDEGRDVLQQKQKIKRLFYLRIKINDLALLHELLE